MQGTEKRTNDVKVRLEDSLFLTLSKLADADSRTLADYLHHTLFVHANGYGSKVNRTPWTKQADE